MYMWACNYCIKIDLKNADLSLIYLFTFPLFQNIAPNPAFVLDGVSRFDFGQGILGRKNLFNL